MISVEEAREIILSKIVRLASEEVPILKSLGRVLDEDISADADIPPFDNSAMDGYAIRSQDSVGASIAKPVELKVLEDVAAGAIPTRPVGRGEAVRIMTGAKMPEGADAVVMVENTRRAGGNVLVLKPARPGENMRFAGEYVKEGEIVIPRGKRVIPGDVGMMASVGRVSARVVKRPTVAIISTGDELIDISAPLSPGKVRNSNAYSIAAQVLDTGCIPLILGIAKDTREDLIVKIREGTEADMIITTGGVSVGDYDLVKDILAEMGEMLFWKVAMKPGKPLAFGLIDEKPTLGLPGNPTSSMVSFEQFARPALLKMSGREDIFRMRVEAVFDGSFVKKSGRRNMVRVTVVEEDGIYRARLSGPQQSGNLMPMALANGLMFVPEEVEEVKAGQRVIVHLLEPVVSQIKPAKGSGV